MGKKYTPSGYIIVDLTELDSILDGDTISPDASEDAKILHSTMKEIFEMSIIKKPIMLRIIYNGRHCLAYPDIILDSGKVSLIFNTIADLSAHCNIEYDNDIITVYEV